MLREIVEAKGNKIIRPYVMLDDSKTDGAVLVIGETPNGNGISLTNSGDGIAIEWGEGEYKFIDNPKDIVKDVKKHTGLKVDTSDDEYKNFIGGLSVSEGISDNLYLGIARASGRGGAKVKDAKSGLVYKITKEEEKGIYTAVDPEGKSVKVNLNKGQWGMLGKNGIERSPRK